MLKLVQLIPVICFVFRLNSFNDPKQKWQRFQLKTWRSFGNFIFSFTFLCILKASIYDYLSRTTVFPLSIFVLHFQMLCFCLWNKWILSVIRIVFFALLFLFRYCLSLLSLVPQSLAKCRTIDMNWKKNVWFWANINRMNNCFSATTYTIKSKN